MLHLSPQEIEYQVSHIRDDRSKTLVFSSAFCMAIAFTAVTLRFLSRSLGNIRFGADDYVIALAFVFGLGEAISTFICVHYGGGKHAILLKNPEAFAKSALATEVLYSPAICCVKISCLLLYRRLFPNRRFQTIIWMIGIFVFIYLWVVVFTAIFQCRPVRAAWDFTVANPHCLKFNIVAMGMAIVNCVTDFVTCLLPIPMLWGLQLPKSKKIPIIIIFSLGLFVCAVSIYRITVISRLSLVDGPWADVDPAIWSIVEVSVGILCACLPTLRPLANNVLKGSTRLLSLSRSWTSSTGERGSGSSSEEKSLSLSRDSGGSQQQQEQDFPRHRQQQHGPSLYECYDPTKTRNRSMDTPPSSAFHSSSYPSRPPPSTQIRPRTETQGFSAMSKYNQHSPVYPYYTSHTNSTSTAAAASSHHSSSYRPQPPPKSHPTTTTASKSRPEIYIQSDVDVSSSSPSPHRPA